MVFKVRKNKYEIKFILNSRILQLFRFHNRYDVFKMKLKVNIVVRCSIPIVDKTTENSYNFKMKNASP